MRAPKPSPLALLLSSVTALLLDILLDLLPVSLLLAQKLSTAQMTFCHPSNYSRVW